MDACVPELGDACSLGQCVPLPPPPFVGRMCIVAEGEVDCPDDSLYAVPYVLHDGADDTRTCDCSCEPDVTCTGTLQAHSGGTCSSLLTTAMGTTCIGFFSNIGSARVVNGTIEAQCDGVGSGKPMGAIMPTGVRTLCCTED
jgi:hypothetical protein